MSKMENTGHFKQNVLSGFLFGVGFVAFIDEAVFHQLLRWHHFYDKSTPAIGLVADGFFHAFSWFATVGGLFMMADLRKKQAFMRKRWWGSVLLGAGSFQLYDGLFQHKVLRIHQIRYVENLFVYDMVWNITALVMVVAGLMIVYSRKPARKVTKQ